MTMRHTQIQPRTMMNEVFVSNEPDRRAIERMRLDASLTMSSTIRRATTPTSARVIQMTHRGANREPIAIDHFAPTGSGVAAALNYYDPKSTFDRAGMGSNSYMPTVHSQNASFRVTNTAADNFSRNLNGVGISAASSTSTSRNSSFSQQQQPQRSMTPTLNRSMGNNGSMRLYSSVSRKPENGERVFGDKANLFSPRSFADLNAVGGGPSYHDGKYNNTRKPAELLGGIKQSADWAYALRNDTIKFVNKKPPPGFRGKGKPRVLPRGAAGSNAGSRNDSERNSNAGGD